MKKDDDSHEPFPKRPLSNDFQRTRVLVLRLVVSMDYLRASGIKFEWSLKGSGYRLPCGSVGKESACRTGDPGSTPGSGRSLGEGNGNPLQYSCLGNPTDRGACWARVHGVARVRHYLATKPPPRWVGLWGLITKTQHNHWKVVGGGEVYFVVSPFLAGDAHGRVLRSMYKDGAWG